MRNEKKVLLGATTEGTIVFANICLGDEERSFSVSFDEVRPFEATDEYLKEHFESTMECYDKEGLYDLCEKYDCKPSELHDELYWQTMHYGDGVYEIIDISLYPESFTVEGCDDDVYFESDGCGQHDTRKYLIPIDKDFSEWLHFHWDKDHLKVIDGTKRGVFKNIIEAYEEDLGDEEKWIQNWLDNEWYPSTLF